MFREGLKQELRLLKQESDLLSKDQRKNAFRIKRQQMEVEHADRERQFLDNLNQNHEASLRRLSDGHREKIALLERQFLQQKQQLLRLVGIYLPMLYSNASSVLKLRSWSAFFGRPDAHSLGFPFKSAIALSTFAETSNGDHILTSN